MSDPYVHLHVASGYSLRYGASHPHVLVQRAADHGMDTLALTDRDGCYGAVKFVQACQSANIRPILGTNLAVRNEGALQSGNRGVNSQRSTTRRNPARRRALSDAHDRG